MDARMMGPFWTSPRLNSFHSSIARHVPTSGWKLHPLKRRSRAKAWANFSASPSPVLPNEGGWQLSGSSPRHRDTTDRVTLRPQSTLLAQTHSARYPSECEVPSCFVSS